MWTTSFIPHSPRIAVDRTGEGPLLVFLHGIGGNRSNWHDQLPVFGRDFHAVAWDARGYGLSDDYAGPLDFGWFADDLARLLDHFKAETAHLCGLSMGGRILQDFYSRYASRVATLVLCDTMPGFAASFTPEKRAEFVRLRKLPLMVGKEPKDIAAEVARTLLSPKASPAAFQKLVDSMSALRNDPYIKTIEASTHFDRVADLANIRVPTLLIYGADDTLTPPALGRSMADKIPGAEMVVIDDAGHLPNIERPEAFNAPVLEFLRRHIERARNR